MRNISFLILIFLIFAGALSFPHLSTIGALTNTQSQTQRMEPGRPVERELKGGEVHQYQVEMEAGQFLHAIVDQRGIDVVVIVFAPNGQKVFEVDSPNGDNGPEPVYLLGETPGAYRLEIRSLEPTALAGKYEIRIEALRAPEEKDLSMIQAFRLFADAGVLRQKRDGASVSQAIEKYEQALPLWRMAGNKGKEAETLSNLGYLYYNYFGDSLKAREYHEQEAPLQHELRDEFSEAVAWNNLGYAYKSLGDFSKAEEAIKKSLQLHRIAGRQENVGVELDTLGMIYRGQGKWEQAIEHCQQALAIFREIKNAHHISVALGALGGIYSDLGDYSRALDFSSQSLEVARSANDQLQIMMMLIDVADRYYFLQDYEKAVALYAQAVDLARKLGNRRNEGVILTSLGNLYKKLGDNPKAREAYEKALPLTRSTANRQAESVVLKELGLMVYLSGDKQKGKTMIESALSLTRVAQYRRNEITTLNDLALIERFDGNFNQARAYVEEAIGLAESLRINVIDQTLRSSWRASLQMLYENYIDLLMSSRSEKNVITALQVSERSRARSLLEMLTESRADIYQGADPGLLQKERSLRQQLNAKAAAQDNLVNREHRAGSAEIIAREIVDLTERLKEVEREIRTSSPRYAALTQPQSLDITEIQGLLDDRTVLLEFAPGERQSWMWAVTPTEVMSFQLPPYQEIGAAAKKFYGLLTARQPNPHESSIQYASRVADADAKLQAEASALSRMLLSPVASKLNLEWKGKRLVIVASGALDYLPFAALPVPPVPEAGAQAAEGYQSLIAAHEIVNLPSASVLAAIRSESAGRLKTDGTLAILADPVFDANDPRVAAARKRESGGKLGASVRSAEVSSSSPASNPELMRSARSFNREGFSQLPFSRKEADVIAGFIPRTKLLKATGFKANRATATSGELARYQIVHFATHGLLNSEHPELSGLVLSLVDQNGAPQDGFLRMREIYNLQLPADVIVLSACQTALGKEINGEGLVGLTRGFMYAGAERVVASLWQVDDLATSELMKGFYRGMLLSKMRPAAALRAAQIEMMKQKRWATPYFWAAFTIQGEWR
ncbi:MAG TPA: CHAT domain-containing tetratricopeptide repeat protein [Blastocatellia bacterium]|nr:CHAT domain-containing tetratricopeptide repeat protein [Blastocatellia bacterium]